jgi:hypothetical protein
MVPLKTFGLVLWLAFLSGFGFIRVGDAHGQSGTSVQASEMPQGLYDQGDFKGAIAAYEALIKTYPANGHLYFNLGNALYRNQEKGRAMAAYLAARQLMPRDPDVRANLKFILASVPDRLDAVQPQTIVDLLMFWEGNFSVRELAFGSAWLLGLGGLLLGLQLVPKLRGIGPLGYWAFGLGALVAMAFSISFTTEEKWGAISASIAKVTSGPSEGSTVVFELHEGAPFVVEAADKGWYQIALSDGKKGWVPLRDATVY